MQRDVKALVEQLQPLEADFAEDVDAIRREVKSFEVAQKAVEDENRDLVIAIVGRVKSGKSSFLNALLFKGESVLPQAATPMTAALTFIRYDKTCHAEVEFFSEGDWETFKRKKAKCDEERKRVEENLKKDEDDLEREAQLNGEDYQRRTFTKEDIGRELLDRLSEDQRAAYELVTMAAKAGTDVSAFLGKTERIDGATPLELAGKLRDYVGANGRFTPIVCATTIYLNDPGLEGYCVIDTPGTNDPVISRGKKTQDNLKRADVVFVVSPQQRFFDNPDLVLCSQNLPANGVNRFRVVLSQFDLAILENRSKVNMSLSPVKRLVDVLNRSRNEQVEHFRQTVRANKKLAEEHHAADLEKWNRLLYKEDGSDNVPICVSSLFYGLAQHWGAFTKEEQEMFDKFNGSIPGLAIESRDLLYKISFMDSVFKEIDEVKAGKPETIARKKQDMAVVPMRRIGEMVSDLLNRVKEQIEVLETSDLAKMEAELAMQTSLIEQGRAKIDEVFDSKLAAAQEKFADILGEMRESKSRYMQLAVDEESHQTSEVHYEYRGGFGIVDAIFGPKQVVQYYTYRTRYADAYQAVDQVEAFANKAQQLLERGIRSVVSSQALRRDIVKATFDFLQAGGRRDYDVNSLKSQIERTVHSIEIPDADFGAVDYASLITRSFSGGRVEDDQIDLLKAAQREALQNVINDLDARAKEKIAAIERSLEQAKLSFVDNLIGDLKQKRDDLVAKFENKTENCERLKSYIPILEGCLK